MKQNGFAQIIVILAVLAAAGLGGFFVYRSNMMGQDSMMPEEVMMEDITMEEEAMMEGEEKYVHGIALMVDGADYYLDGPADGHGGARDIPGHSWMATGQNTLKGKHFNSGPNNEPKFWSSDANDGALLYDVEAVIDDWTPTKANKYAQDGFVHYHELVSMEDGSKHPTQVVWLKHTAVAEFTLDGEVVGGFAHQVKPGVDLKFPPNGLTPYSP